MKWIRRGLAAALFLGLVWLAIEFRDRNQDPFVVDLVFWQTPALATWIVVLAALGIGFAVAGLAASWSVLRSRLVARRFRRAALDLESEVHQLRNLPLAAEDPGPAGSGAAPAIPERSP